MRGLFACVTQGNCSEDLYLGLDYHSHIGTKMAGFTVLEETIREPIVHSIEKSSFRTEFEEDFEYLKAGIGLGVLSTIDDDKQPLRFKSKIGNFALCTSGSVLNARDLLENLLQKGVDFSESDESVNQTELLGKSIIHSGKSLVDGILKTYEKVVGSVSLMLLSERDKSVYTISGVFPLIIGRRSEDWAVASETTAFRNLGYNDWIYPDYYNIIPINHHTKDISPVDRAEGETAFCSFLPGYFGFPTSSYYTANTEIVREVIGGYIAERDQVEPDSVIGIMDSGFTYSLGYVKKKIELVKKTSKNAFKLFKEGSITLEEVEKSVMAALRELAPLRRPLIKYSPSYSRSYLAMERVRDLIANLKQISIPEIIKGSKIVIWDDSIRRGTQLLELLKTKIIPHNPAELHVRIGTPPQFSPCLYEYEDPSNLATYKAIASVEGVDVKDLKDIRRYQDYGSVKYNKMVDKIKDSMGADSLLYATIPEVRRAILETTGKKLSEKDLCTYCWRAIQDR